MVFAFEPTAFTALVLNAKEYVVFRRTLNRMIAAEMNARWNTVTYDSINNETGVVRVRVPHTPCELVQNLVRWTMTLGDDLGDLRLLSVRLEGNAGTKVCPLEAKQVNTTTATTTTTTTTPTIILLAPTTVPVESMVWISEKTAGMPRWLMVAIGAVLTVALAVVIGIQCGWSRYTVVTGTGGLCVVAGAAVMIVFVLQDKLFADWCRPKWAVCVVIGCIAGVVCLLIKLLHHCCSRQRSSSVDLEDYKAGLEMVDMAAPPPKKSKFTKASWHRAEAFTFEPANGKHLASSIVADEFWLDAVDNGPKPTQIRAVVKITRGQGLGIGIGNEAGFNYVRGMKPGGNAEKCGSIRAGDRVQMINDKQVSTLTREKCIATLKQASQTSNEVTLILNRPPAGDPGNLPSAERHASPPPAVEETTFGKTTTTTSAGGKKSKIKKEILANIAYGSIQAAPEDPGYNFEAVVLTVRLLNQGGGFGMSFVGPTGKPQDRKRGVYISGTKDGGAAQLTGELRKGQRVNSVNGQNVQNATRKTVTSLFKGQSDVVLEVVDDWKGFTQYGAEVNKKDKTLKDTNLPVTHVVGPETVVLKDIVGANETAEVTIAVPEGEGLGVAIVNDNNANYVSGMKPGGNVDKSGMVGVGDRLLKINKTDVSSASREDCIGALKAAASRSTEVTLLVEHVGSRTWDSGNTMESKVQPLANASSAADKGQETATATLKPPNFETIKVTINVPTGEGLGIGVQNVKNQIIVTGTKPGGNAHKTGKIEGGDRIMKVNATSVAKVSKEECVAALKAATQASTTVVLSLRRKVGAPKANTAPKAKRKAKPVSKAKPKGTTLGQTVGAQAPKAEPAQEGTPPGQTVGTHQVEAVLNVPSGESIGIGVGNDSGVNYVRGMKEGGNAEKAGVVQAGDIFYTINGKVVQRLSREDCIGSLKAAANDGTKVTIVFERPGSMAALEGLEVTSASAPKEANNIYDVGVPNQRKKQQPAGGVDSGEDTAYAVVAPLPATRQPNSDQNNVYDVGVPTRKAAKSKLINVELSVPTGTGVGVSIKALEKGVVVSGMAPEGNAQKSGLLKIGDLFVKVNGANVKNSSKAEVVAALKAGTAASTTLRLAIRRSPGGGSAESALDGGGVPQKAQTKKEKKAQKAGSGVANAASPPASSLPMERVEAVVNVPRGEGLGIGVVNDGRTNAVSGLKPGGNADKCGMIRPGDVFRFINHTDVGGCSRESCIDVLKAGAASSTTVTIIFERPPTPSWDAMALSKDEALALLRKDQPGSFVIRSSTKGAAAISMIKGDLKLYQRVIMEDPARGFHLVKGSSFHHNLADLVTFYSDPVNCTTQAGLPLPLHHPKV